MNVAPKVKRTVTMTVRIDGVRETLAAFNKLPKDANDALRDQSQQLARALVPKIQAAAGRAPAPQARLVARTVKAGRDRVPVVTAGGTRKLGRHRAPAYGLLFASEFGMKRRSGWFAAPRYSDTRHQAQYPGHTGRRGAWFFPSVEREQATINREWNELADRIRDKFGRGA